MATRVGQLLNYTDLSRVVGVSANTVKSWVNTLESSGIIVLLSPYFKNIGKRMVKSPKIYFSDNGLICSLLNIDSLSSYEHSIYHGNLWENFVVTELLKTGFMVDRNLFFFRDQHGLEMDFIAEKSGITYLIEAKSSENPDRKKLSFEKVAKTFKTKVEAVVACGIQEKQMIKLKSYSMYNPLFGNKI